MATQALVSPDTLITIKLQIKRVTGGCENRRVKLPLRDLGASSLPSKVSTMRSMISSFDPPFLDYLGTMLIEIVLIAS